MQHGAGVADAAERADESADEGERRTFAEEQSADLFRRETEREQRADFGGALLQTELEEHRHQQQRRHDDEQAEADEQPTEVLRLRGGLERLFAHRLEAQAEFLGFERGENFLFQRGAKGFSGLEFRLQAVRGVVADCAGRSNSSARLPLTLALSLGERGQRLSVLWLP